MVEAQIFMAAANEEGRRKLLDDLKKEFPELPEELISETLKKNPGNLQQCIHVLQEESNRSLYGGMDEDTDSPWPIYPSVPIPPTEPLSISIPNSSVHYNPHAVSLQPVLRPATVAQPSPSSVTSTVSGSQVDRQPSVDVYHQAILQHQQQRLDRLRKELEIERHKLNNIKGVVQREGQEIVDKKFRVAGNPSLRDVNLLQDENDVLRQEINQMTQEIDKLGVPIGDVEGPQNSFSSPGNYVTSPPTVYRYPSTPGTCSPSPPPYHLHKSASFSRPTTPNGHPPSLNRMWSILGLQNPPTVEEVSNEGSSRENSLENAGWVYVHPGQPLAAPSSTASAAYNPNNDTGEQNWTCRRCTFGNHPALNICEICGLVRS